MLPRHITFDSNIIQLAQETQHIILRIDKIGGFKRKCGDYPIILDTFQKIMNACHKKWNPKKSPPILHCRRLGQHGCAVVSPNQYSPYELFYKSKYLKDPELFPLFQKAVLALWQSKYTTNPKLQAQLLRDQSSSKLSHQTIIDQLTWCIQNSPPQFQLLWPSV